MNGDLDLSGIGHHPPPDSPLMGLAIALLALYLAGAISLWVRGRHWSVGRTIWFTAGTFALLVLVTSGAETYSRDLLSVFMFEQLTLMIAIPPLLVLGSPGTLLLRATPHRGPGRLILSAAIGALRSRPARWLLHPALTIPLFLISYYGLYLGTAAETLLRMPAGHALLELLFLGAGLLFAIPILSGDPLPHLQGHLASVVDVFVEMGLHAFFGVIVMMSATLLVPSFADSTRALGVDPLADQRIAGGLAWGYGEGPTVLILIYVMHRWFRDDTRRAARRDRDVDQHGDAELDAYNQYLARIGRRGSSGE